jgi:hypothetical protein
LGNLLSATLPDGKQVDYVGEDIVETPGYPSLLLLGRLRRLRVSFLDPPVYLIIRCSLCLVEVTTSIPTPPDTSLTPTGRYNPTRPATSNKGISSIQAGSATSRNTLKALAPYF